MSENSENQVLEPEQNIELKTGNKKKSKFFLLISVLLFILLGAFLVYSYHNGNKKNPDASFFEKIGSGVNLNSASSEFNYAFNFDANFKELDKDGNIEESVSINLQDGQIYSSEDAFKQRLKIGQVEVSEDGQKNTVLKDIDLVSDMFKVYYKYSDDSGILDSINLPKSSKNYKLIDNERIVLSILGDLSKNETIKELVLSSFLSNPQGYLEKNKTLEKLKQELKNDKLIDYLFVKNGEAIKEDGKTKQNLIFSDKTCIDLLPVFSNIYKSVSSKNGLPLGENPFSDSKVCNEYINTINSFSQLGAQIYKIGDLEKGNYDFVISAGNIFSAKLTYENHNLSKWQSNGQYLENISFFVKGDISGLKESKLKIDYTDDNISVNGEIINGNGEIKVEAKAGDGITGNLALDAYYFKDIDLTIIENGENLGTVKGYLKEKDGELKISLSDKGEKFDGLLKYNKEKLDIDFSFSRNGKNLGTIKGYIGKKAGDLKVLFTDNGQQINGLLKYDKNYLELNLDAKQIKINLLIKDENINLKTDINGEGIDINGYFKNLMDFKIYRKKLSGEEFLLFEGKRDGDKVDYKFNYKEGKYADFKGKAVLTKGEKDTFKTINLKGDFENTGFNNNKGSFDVNFSYKKGGAKFEIPSNFEEVGDSLLDTYVVPAFNPTILKKQYKFVEEKILPIYIATVASTVAYITLQDYPKQARDTKRLSDISFLEEELIVKTVDGSLRYSDFIKSSGARDIEFSNGDLTYSGKVGDIDTSKLELEEADENFKDPISDKSYAFLYLEGGTGNDRVYCFEIGSFSETNKINYSRGNCINSNHLINKTDINQNPNISTLENSLFSLKGSRSLYNLINKY